MIYSFVYSYFFLYVNFIIEELRVIYCALGEEIQIKNVLSQQSLWNVIFARLKMNFIIVAGKLRKIVLQDISIHYNFTHTVEMSFRELIIESNDPRTA